MSAELLLLRSQRVPSLPNVRVLKKLGFSEWIGEMGYRPLSPIESANFKIAYTDNLSFASATATDLIRMSNAALETMSNISKHRIFPKSLGWALIKAYYGAYFSAHALMRAYCFGVIKLESGQVSILRDTVSSAGFTDDGSLIPGYYSMAVDAAAGEIQLSFIGQNPHESLWKGFRIFLEIISTKVQNGPGISREKTNLISMFGELQQAIASVLPSQIRNKLNYRQEYGVWYPFASYRAKAHEDLLTFLSRWNEDPLLLSPSCRQKEETKRLAAIAVCTVSLVRETMLDIESSAILGRAFSGRKTTALISQLTH